MSETERISISIDDIERQSIPADKPFILSIENMSMLNINTLMELKQKYNITGIKIENKEEYDIDTYAKMRRALDKIVSGIDINAPDLDKFTKIYERIGRMINYDREEEKYVKSEGAEGKKNKDAHTLKGGLVDNLAVCEGYGKILNEALNCVRIDSLVVYGREKNNRKIGHVWNQVKIDNIWYNTDVTYDEGLLKDGSTPNFCLQSDEEFQHGEFDILTNVYEINSTYNQETLCKKYFEGRRFKIENDSKLEYTADEVNKLISELSDKNNYVSDGINIKIKDIIPGARVGIILSNIVDGKEIRFLQKSGILMDYGQLTRFMREYTEKKDIEKNEVTKEGTTVYRKDGINLQFDSKMKNTIKKLGININELITPKYQINADDIINSIEFFKSKRNSVHVEINKTKENYEVKLKKDDRTFEISEDELIIFFQKFGEKYSDIKEAKGRKNQVNLMADENINVILSKNVKEKMLETACDFSNVFSEDTKALTPYHENVWKKIVNYVKDRMPKKKYIPPESKVEQPRTTMNLKDWIRVGELQPLSQKNIEGKTNEDREIGE